MLTRSSVSEKQKKSQYFATSASDTKYMAMSFENAVKQCQAYINKVATHYYRQVEDVKTKREMTERYRIECVDT